MAASRSLTLRTKEWKYIAPFNGEPVISWGPAIETGYLNAPQLYHYKKDPAETRNVADQHPDIVSRMQETLAKVREKAK